MTRTTHMPSTDRIEKTITLRAPKARVWRALTDSGEFGTWFKIKLDGPFVIGRTVLGHITIPGWEHLKAEFAVERIEPQDVFAYRWHPYPSDPNTDYSREPMTLVEFRLEEIPEGTRLTVIESGFDKIPAYRRDEAFRMNTQGWTGQLENIRGYVES